MSKKPKKPHYIRPPFEPQWEDEAAPDARIDPRLKEEEESKLFKHTIENASNDNGCRFLTEITR